MCFSYTPSLLHLHPVERSGIFVAISSTAACCFTKIVSFRIAKRSRSRLPDSDRVSHLDVCCIMPSAALCSLCSATHVYPSEHVVLFKDLRQNSRGFVFSRAYRLNLDWLS
jgi:hypothetical protein